MQVLLAGSDLTVEQYLELDDHVIIYHFNIWQHHQDKVLADLCRRFLNRRLFKSVPINEGLALQFDTGDELRKACEKAGFLYKYYLVEDVVPHSSYEDYYAIQKNQDSNMGEKSERIYLFKDTKSSEELSVASEIIGAIRNKKIFVRRLYYPQEIENTIKAIF